MGHTSPRRFLMIFCIFLLSVTGADASAAVDADAFHKSVMNQPGIKNTKQPGEQYAWMASYHAHSYIEGYHAYENEKWVANAIEFFDYYLARNVKDPDGYYGTIGAGFDKQKTKDFQYRWDTVVGDAIECMPIVRLAEIILNNPRLKKKYGRKAKQYVAYAEKMCYEKWDKRGCYYEDAAGYGSYHRYGYMIDPANNTWVETSNEIISENLNKHYDMGMVFICLYRITGDEKYKKRVLAIFKRAKAMFRLLKDEDRIVWNFWMPHGPYDLEGTSPKSWVGVHPSRSGYQKSEVGFFIEIYDSGLVFDKSDLDRMIATNVWMKNTANFKVSADGTSKAGTLWTGFTRFNDELYNEFKKTYTKKGAKQQIKRDYVEYMRSLGDKPQYVKKASDLEPYACEIQEGKFLTLATVIPNTIEIANGDRVKIIAQLRASEKYTVEILNEKGKSLGVIHKENYVMSGGNYKTIIWDGTNPKTKKKKAGSYLVRFTLGKESRTWPVSVIKGTKKAKSEVFVLTQGARMDIDFESDINKTLWKLEGGAAVVKGKGRKGSSALSLSSGHQARMFFGDLSDLKAKVRFWVYDEGKKSGKKTATGGKWGVQMANGNKFVLAQMWRKYLSGDTMYIWINNGENQWFSVHPSYLERKQGWNEYVYDFSGDGMAHISCNGVAMHEKRMKPAAFIPKGAVALYFQGPGHNMGHIFVDDITITYP